MIEFFRIQRFKSLNDASFTLSALNVFSGLNAMGKSSVIQALLLLRQSYEKNALPDKGLLLKGEYLNLGTGKDILTENAENETIEFIITLEGTQPIKFVFDYAANSELLPIITKHKLPDEMPAFLSNNFQYLAADRISPKAVYEASDYYIKELNYLGHRGEYTAHYIAEYGLSDIKISHLKHPSSKSLTLLENLEKWMSEISPGIRIIAKQHLEMNNVSLNYAYEQNANVTANYKPQNVGFGLTFILPVLVALLRSKAGDMLIAENPEAHLHPAAQSVLGKLCCLAAQNGVQIFVETHSDHFLNGIRVAVKESIIAHENVSLFYLERNQDTEHETVVISPEIASDGTIDVWPSGFFDETDKQLEKLL